jgi:MFS family permease
MTFMGFASNYSGLLAARWFLGLAEAGLYSPQLSYLTIDSLECNFTCPVGIKRKEFGIRSAIFFSAAALSGSFGGLLAAAIANMKGLGGKPGWAWIVLSLLFD